MYHYFTDKDDLVSAVIDFQTDQVLNLQHLGLDRIESIEDLRRWRDIMVGVVRKLGGAGGCPLGSMASELSECDPVARARLTRSFAQWENMISDGLASVAARGELAEGTDVSRIALAMLAAVQGGLLLSQVRRDTAPLEAAVDTMIEHLSRLGMRRTVQSLQPGDDELQSERELLLQWNGELVGDRDGSGIAGGIEAVERRRHFGVLGVWLVTARRRPG